MITNDELLHNEAELEEVKTYLNTWTYNKELTLDKTVESLFVTTDVAVELVNHIKDLQNQTLFLQTQIIDLKAKVEKLENDVEVLL